MTDYEPNKVFLTPLSAAEIHAFQALEWQQARTSTERYGLFPKRNAFGLRASDVLQLSPNIADVKIDRKENALHIIKPDDNEPVIFDLTRADLLDALFEKLQTPQPFADVESTFAKRWDSKIIKDTSEQLLGACIDIPQTIKALENDLSLNGLLRFPMLSPYKVPRAYWENSIALRRALPLLYESLDSKDEFFNAIAGLHRLATTGESGHNVYGGAGGLPTEPGIFRRQDIKTGIAYWCQQSVEWWLKFLRVPVKLMRDGTIKSINKRAMVDISQNGLQCMHLYEADGRLVFKLLDEARDNLRCALHSAEKKNMDVMLGQLARFLQLFVTAHPFNNINASIAMNIVNDILEKQGLGRLPHLYLDYVAQRTRVTDFSLVFKAVFDKHRLTDCGDNTAQASMKQLLEAAANYLEAEIKLR